MSGAAKFDEKTAKRVEAMYQTPDVVGQRRAVMAALALEAGEHVLDIGVGPGLLLEEMANVVGPEGAARGVDTSADMLEMTRGRCAHLSQVAVEMGDATALSFPDESFDAAAVTQVYLYVADLGKALAELHRVLKPGGRALVLDTDWDSVVWHTEDRARMARVLQAWERHFHEARMARLLPAALRRAGLALERTSVSPIVNVGYEEATYSAAMIRNIRSFVSDKHGISRAEADAWAEELEARGRDGSYFFSLNRYLFLARRPH
jgi:ubiquinone/menaquinone biosynthesis C-methylase UbiE